jgi:hypothetical protein
MARLERYAPLSGVAAVLLWIVGAFLLEKDDRPDEDVGSNFRDWVQANDTALITGAIVFGFGVLFFLWFLGTLRSTLFAAEGGTGRVSTIAFGSGVACSVSMMFAVLPHAQAAFDIDNTSDTSAAALVHMGDAFFGGIELFAIPMLLAAALVVLRHGPLPRWHGWFSLVVALILVIIPIGFVGVFIGLPLWVLATSVLLYRQSTGEPIATPPQDSPFG